jgi:hypothetical protein
VVLKVELPEEIPVLSFRNNDDFPEIKTGSLGYRAGKRPVSPRSGDITRDDFLHQLEADPGFTNPQAVPNLCQLLGLTSVSPRLTLLRDILTAEYAESDFAESLRKTQRFKWSMKTVAIGVDHFKSGKHTSALDYFNHALEIDPSNVEGLVARGALAATTGKYREGLADFEKALSIKSNHRNARNYFVETQVVFGRELEVQGKIDSAMACYREALTFDPEEPTAKERLGALTVAMETKVCWSLSKGGGDCCNLCLSFLFTRLLWTYPSPLDTPVPSGHTRPLWTHPSPLDTPGPSGHTRLLWTHPSPLDTPVSSGHTCPLWTHCDSKLPPTAPT